MVFLGCKVEDDEEHTLAEAMMMASSTVPSQFGEEARLERVWKPANRLRTTVTSGCARKKIVEGIRTCARTRGMS